MVVNPKVLTARALPTASQTGKPLDNFGETEQQQT
jgi:hypothetical protein